MGYFGHSIRWFYLFDRLRIFSEDCQRVSQVKSIFKNPFFLILVVKSTISKNRDSHLYSLPIMFSLYIIGNLCFKLAFLFKDASLTDSRSFATFRPKIPCSDLFPSDFSKIFHRCLFAIGELAANFDFDTAVHFLVSTNIREGTPFAPPPPNKREY